MELRQAGFPLLDLCRLVFLATRSRSALVAENLFLRKQLALLEERKVKPHRADDSTRWLMAALSRLFDWRRAPGSWDSRCRFGAAPPRL